MNSLLQSLGVAPETDDPLLGALRLALAHHGIERSRDALLSGLPPAPRLTPELFLRAARAVGCNASYSRRELDSIPDLLLPVVLATQDGGAAAAGGAHRRRRRRHRLRGRAARNRLEPAAHRPRGARGEIRRRLLLRAARAAPRDAQRRRRCGVARWRPLVLGHLVALPRLLHRGRVRCGAGQRAGARRHLLRDERLRPRDRQPGLRHACGRWRSAWPSPPVSSSRPAACVAG